MNFMAERDEPAAAAQVAFQAEAPPVPARSE